MCGPNSFLSLSFIWIIPISLEEFLDQTCICHKSQQLEITKPLLTKHYLVKPLNKYLKDMICTRNEINSFNLWTTWEFDHCPTYFNNGANPWQVEENHIRVFDFSQRSSSEQQTLNVWTKFIPFVVIHMNYPYLSRRVFGPNLHLSQITTAWNYQTSTHIKALLSKIIE